MFIPVVPSYSSISKFKLRTKYVRKGLRALCPSCYGTGKHKAGQTGTLQQSTDVCCNAPGCGLDSTQMLHFKGWLTTCMMNTLPTQKLNPVPKKGVEIRTPTICEIVSPLIDSWSKPEVDATVACSAALGSDVPIVCCWPACTIDTAHAMLPNLGLDVRMTLARHGSAAG